MTTTISSLSLDPFFYRLTFQTMPTTLLFLVRVPQKHFLPRALCRTDLCSLHRHLLIRVVRRNNCEPEMFKELSQISG